ncbi:hypothetical protein WJX84_001030 [Apatococcus fuscideae]|uniref:Uncharacterized protein n=1 Tax=Apatococcus fuscideae TaxID=2026836 RepID=A0AAW1T7X2_9CHLO
MDEQPVKKLRLKGDKPKKKKRKPAKEEDPAERTEADAPETTATEIAAASAKPKPANPLAVSVQSGHAYEQEFPAEVLRAKKPKIRSTPWGSSYRAAPEHLHGYSSKVKGKTAEERLDMRAATKADKFCK